MTGCMYHPWVSVIVISDIVLRICIASGAYLLYLFRAGIRNALGIAEFHIQYHFRVTVTLTSELVFRMIVPDGYLI